MAQNGMTHHRISGGGGGGDNSSSSSRTRRNQKIIRTFLSMLFNDAIIN